MSECVYTVVRDCELGGKQLEAGDRIVSRLEGVFVVHAAGTGHEVAALQRAGSVVAGDVRLREAPRARPSHLRLL